MLPFPSEEIYGIANYLKVFATQFSDIFLGDNIYAQHYVWHFSDDFNRWRINPDVVQDIKDAAAEMSIPDHGYTQQIGDITRVWDFVVLDEADGDAIFFAYRCRDIGSSGQEAPIPETGDGANLVLWSALIAVSAIGMMVVLRRKKEA